MNTKAQHAPREDKVSISDLLTKYWPPLLMGGLFIIMGFQLKATQDLHTTLIKEDHELIIELQKARNQDREMLIEMRSDIKYLIKQTKEK